MTGLAAGTGRRIAIGQLRMRWTGEENTAAIVEAIGRAAATGARLCVFPELAVTGFHRQIASQAQPALVAGWRQRVKAACAAHGVAVSIGAPSFGGDGRVYNANLLIDATGAAVGQVRKNGLTPAEATFFARGHERPVHPLLGLRCSAVLCREISDLADVAAQLPPGSVDLIVWPGAMRPAVDGSSDDPDRHVKEAQAMAVAVGAWIVQANWPNSLNHPGESEFAGQSVVIDPAGAVSARLPVARSGVGVCALGSSSIDWLEDEGETAIG